MELRTRVSTVDKRFKKDQRHKKRSWQVARDGAIDTRRSRDSWLQYPSSFLSRASLDVTSQYLHISLRMFLHTWVKVKLWSMILLASAWIVHVHLRCYCRQQWISPGRSKTVIFAWLHKRTTWAVRRTVDHLAVPSRMRELELPGTVHGVHGAPVASAGRAVMAREIRNGLVRRAMGGGGAPGLRAAI